LNGDLVVRQGLSDLVDFAFERLVVDGIERQMQVVLQKQPDDRMRRHQIDLETDMLRNHALCFQRREFRVRAFGDVRIKQIGERDIVHCFAGFQPVTYARRSRGMDPKEFVGFLQGRIVGEHRFEPGNPVRALAGFPIGDAFEALPERGAHGLKDLARACQWHAADEMNGARHRCQSK